MDASQPVKKRIDNLMAQMTLEEKVGQMCQWVGIEHIRDAERNLSEEDLLANDAKGYYPGIRIRDVEQMIREGKISSFLHVLTLEEANYLQGIAKRSRLKIPLLIGIDAIHGNAQVSGATVYPTNIGLASSFDVELVERICRETAKEMRATGSHWNFNPNVEVARDPRWGRVGETFGEDPYLVSKLGVASILGYQGKDFSSPESVIACVKHFAGGSQPVNGTNVSPADISERTLREIFFPPFKAALDAGGYTFMMAHNEVNGVPCHSNSWLMNDILRTEWSFDGFIVSDWMDIERMHKVHRTATSNNNAFYQSVKSGMDMHMHGPHFFEEIVASVKEGRIPEERIDHACARILEAKFRLGLFEQIFVDPDNAKEVLFNDTHRQTALEAARKSIVLLTNNGILPLTNKKYKNIFVTGPCANNQTIMGDWALPQPEENITTVLEGLKQISPEANYTFLDQGWDIRNMDPSKVEKAGKMAKNADLAIVVVGEYALRHKWNDRTCGENVDRSDINLAGLQQQLTENVINSGVPTIVVLINGRPLGVEWIANHADALIEAWEPGAMGGQAVAEVIYGLINPSGKLPVTVPRHVGQLQMVYNHKPTMYFHPYAIGESTPLFEFGHGLSYTSYKYSNLTLDKDKMEKDQTVTVSVEVSNTGSIDGEEIVQLYIRDLYACVTRPVKELKDFARIKIKAGETKVVTFSINAEKLSFYDIDMNWGVEPGDFEIMVGASSSDKKLLKTNLTVI